MRRGTTPTHTFTLPENVDPDTVFSVRIVYAQGGAVKVRREDGDVKRDGNTLAVKLTQAETLSFAEDQPVEVQLRILTVGGDALASNIRSIPVERCLDDEVLA